jgi:hypothetical protein
MDKDVKAALPGVGVGGAATGIVLPPVQLQSDLEQDCDG